MKLQRVKDEIHRWMVDWREEVLVPVALECLALYGRIVFGWREIKKKYKKN